MTENGQHQKSDAQALEELSAKLAQSESIRHLVSEVSKATSLEAFFDLLMDYLSEQWGINALQVQLVDNDANQLRHIFFKSTEQIDPEVLEAALNDVPLVDGASISATVALRKKRFYADFRKTRALDSLPEADRNALIQMNIKENLLLPIMQDSECIGVVQLSAIGTRLGLKISAMNQISELMKSLATHIQLVKRKLELESLRKEQDRQIDLIRRISKTIGLQELFDILGEEVEWLAEFDGFLLNLFDEESNHLVCERVVLPEAYKGVEKTYQGFVFEMEETDPNCACFNDQVIVEVTQDTIGQCCERTRDRFDRWEMAHMVILPIIAGGDGSRPHGTLMLFRQHDTINPDRIERMEKLLVIFSEPIRNSLNYDRLQKK